MTFADKEKLKRLDDIINLNYRFTHIQAQYLEYYPELITKEMIDEITADSDISEKEAVVAILTGAFALDNNTSEDNTLLARKYLPRSVRILDAQKYTLDPYYKNVAPAAVNDGDWEIRWETYPAYRAAICDDIIADADFTEIAPLGFFNSDFTFPAVLEGGNEWMTLTPIDVDTVQDAIRDANGNVITFGLGLGYYAYMAARKENVTSLTVVEKSEKIIELFKKHVLPRFDCKEKIRIINADAFEYAEHIMPSEEYDYAFVDTWRDASDGLPMYERMKTLEHLSPKTKFSYWIESFILSRKRSLKYQILKEKVDTGAHDAPKTYDDFIKELYK
ncbi:MAG: hypothetical protein J6Q68_00395 [Clostridia bacterium]|nr:hypothetical protein [Clostridia bacterium]